MRSFMVAIAMIALLTTPVYAQGRPGGKGPPPEPKKTEEKKPTVNESDYKAALDRIPTPHEKPDPWQNVRAAPKPK